MNSPRNNSFRNLEIADIVATLQQLSARIGERFPNSGLYRVCRELEVMAQETSARAANISRPKLWFRGLLAILAAAGAVGAIFIGHWMLGLRSSDELAGTMQGLEAAVNLVIIIGAAGVFLVTLEARWKRQLALSALNEFRSVAHVIDMHQLTKDPSALGGPRTSSSPNRVMSRYELVRYLSYCSEMLSLSSKAAAVYADNIHDAAVIDAVGDIERLTTNLSQKIWQKITLVETDLEDDRGARAVSAGELSQIPHAREAMSASAHPLEPSRLPADQLSRTHQPQPVVARLCDRDHRQPVRRAAVQPGLLHRGRAAAGVLARYALAARVARPGHRDHDQALQRPRPAVLARLCFCRAQWPLLCRAALGLAHSGQQPQALPPASHFGSSP